MTAQFVVGLDRHLVPLKALNLFCVWPFAESTRTEFRVASFLRMVQKCPTDQDLANLALLLPGTKFLQ